ncbi:MAG TPA: hypothetical protein VFH06_00615 [Candidatus Saccharimonadales bacterium]|nr:hypothetical protein [Candidatus Saccharimonadales bacterium]
MARDIPTTNIDISHHVQRQIIIALRQSGPKKYAELKPKGLEGNAYNYHLRNLKSSGLVELREGVYHLTNTGHLVSDAFSFTTHRLMLRPYHYTTLLVTQGNEVLVYIPIRKPQTGKLSLPSGKMHYGDSITGSIEREMKRRNLDEKYTVHQVCPLNVRYILNNEIVVHRPGILWHVAYEGKKNERTTESGATRWMVIQDAAASGDALPELSEGLKRLKAASHEPIDIDFTLHAG